MTDRYVYAGLDLNAPSYYVKALTPRVTVAPRRGDNVISPGSTGRIYVPKPREQGRLAMVVQITDVAPDGASSGPGQLRINVDVFMGVMARDGLHWLFHYWGNETRRILAEVRDEVVLVQTGPHTYDAAVTFTMPFPYWRDATMYNTIGFTGISTSPYEMTLNNEGTAPVVDAEIQIWAGGGCAQPQISGLGVWFRYNGVLAPGDEVIVDCATWQCRLNGVSQNHAISHGGDVRWMILQAGVGTYTFTATDPDNVNIDFKFYKQYV